MGRSEFDYLPPRPAWNAGRKVGAKRPLKPRQICGPNPLVDVRCYRSLRRQRGGANKIRPVETPHNLYLLDRDPCPLDGIAREPISGHQLRVSGLLLGHCA